MKFSLTIVGELPNNHFMDTAKSIVEKTSFRKKKCAVCNLQTMTDGTRIFH